MLNIYFIYISILTQYFPFLHITIPHCCSRQVTFLPLLNEPCSFDLLVYTDKDAVVPQKWEDSDPRYIMNSQNVKLRSFTTSVHKVESMVTYKEADEWEL